MVIIAVPFLYPARTTAESMPTSSQRSEKAYHAVRSDETTFVGDRLLNMGQEDRGASPFGQAQRD